MKMVVLVCEGGIALRSEEDADSSDVLEDRDNDLS